MLQGLITSQVDALWKFRQKRALSKNVFSSALFLAVLSYILIKKNPAHSFLRRASFWRYYDLQTFYASVGCGTGRSFCADVVRNCERGAFTRGGLRTAAGNRFFG